MTDTRDSMEQIEAQAAVGIRCLCGGSRFSVVMEGENSWFSSGAPVFFRALKCRACGLVTTSPRPSPRYEEDEGSDGEVQNASARYRIARLKPFINTQTRMLEVGCSTGALVEQGIKAGARESVGVELSEQKAAYGRGKGRDIRSQRLEECGFADGYFDIVQAHHTLEHVLNLHAMLDEIARVLKPDGIFYVTQARYNSPFVRSASWVGWFPQEHFWHFSEQTLAFLLREHGFGMLHFNCPLHTEYGTAKNALWPAKRAFKLAVKHLRLGDMVDALFQKSRPGSSSQ